MLQRALDRDSLRGVHDKHLLDQIERRVADRIPVRGWEVEARFFNLVGERVWVLRGVEFVGERREAAETNVEDHTERPDIDRPRILAVFGGLKDLGGNV